MQPGTKGQPTLSFAMKVGWAAGDVGSACYIGATMAFLLFFLTEAHGFSPAWAGFAILLPRIVDVITDPLMGAISDRTKSRIGRRRPYLLVGSFFFAVPFYFLFNIPDLSSDAAELAYVTAMYLLTSTGFTMFAIPHAAMIAEMSSDYTERTSIVGFRMMGSRIGILVVTVLGAYLFGSQETLEKGFSLFGAVFAVIILLGGLISFFATRNAPMIEAPLTAFRPLDEFRALFRNRPLALLLMVFLAQNLAIGVAATSMAYFMTFIMNIELQHIGWWLSGGGIVAMLVTPLWMMARTRISKKAMYTAAIVIEMCVYTAIFLLVGPGTLLLLVFIILFMGVGDAACQLAPNSMVADTVEVDELATGERREGTIYGAISFCLKLGMAGGAFVSSIVLDAFGFVPGTGLAVQSEMALSGIRIAYSVLPVLLWVCAFVILRRYDLTEARFEEIQQRLLDRAGTSSDPSENTAAPGSPTSSGPTVAD